jgi:hypothetical protein
MAAVTLVASSLSKKSSTAAARSETSRGLRGGGCGRPVKSISGDGPLAAKRAKRAMIASDRSGSGLPRSGWSGKSVIVYMSFSPLRSFPAGATISFVVVA